MVSKIYNKLSQTIIDLFTPHLDYEAGSEEFETFKYGLDVILFSSIRILMVYVCALLLGIAQYTLVLTVSFAALGIYAFGLHFKHSWQCTLYSFIVYIGGTYLGLYLPIPLVVRIVILALCGVAVFLYAPAETKKRPIPDKQRPRFKRNSIIIYFILAVAILILSALKLEAIANLLLIGLVFRCIVLLPIMFRIFEP